MGTHFVHSDEDLITCYVYKYTAQGGIMNMKCTLGIRMISKLLLDRKHAGIPNPLSFFRSVFLSVFLSLFLSVRLSFFLSVFLSFCLSVFLSFFLSFFLFVFLSFFIYSVFLSFVLPFFLSSSLPRFVPNSRIHCGQILSTIEASFICARYAVFKITYDTN